MFNTIKKIASKIWQYLSLIDDIAVDFLTDLKSLRYQLVIWAFVVNFIVLYLIFLGKADYKLAAVSIALLTAVYGFFFVSKHNEAVMNAAAPTSVNDEAPVDERDPDKIP